MLVRLSQHFTLLFTSVKLTPTVDLLASLEIFVRGNRESWYGVVRVSFYVRGGRFEVRRISTKSPSSFLLRSDSSPPA